MQTKQYKLCEAATAMAGKIIELIHLCPTAKMMAATVEMLLPILAELGTQERQWVEYFKKEYCEAPWMNWFIGASGVATVTPNNNALESYNNYLKHHVLKDNLRAAIAWLLDTGLQTILDTESLEKGGYYYDKDGNEVLRPIIRELGDCALVVSKSVEAAYAMLQAHVGARVQGGSGSGVPQLCKINGVYYVNRHEFMAMPVNIQRVQWYEIALVGDDKMQLTGSLTPAERIKEYREYYASLHKVEQFVKDDHSGLQDFKCNCKVRMKARILSE
jgi:hypothetical protein